MTKKRKIITMIIGIISVIIISLFGAGMYFFHVAEVRAPKTFINNQAMKPTNSLYRYEQEFNKLKKTTWHQMTPGGLKLDAWYVANPQKTHKTIVIAHGFAGNKQKMAAYGEMFIKLGYNVLIPDDRAAGSSAGKLIGFGWNDRKDYVRWIHQIVKKDSHSQIAIFGVSMGGATTMMTAGEKLPTNVKAFIEDCGYDTVKNEIAYQAGAMYHIPAYPLVDIVSLISKVRAGYTYGEASSIKQLHKNTRPMFFIHGGADNFVPTKMVYRNYAATQGPKKIWVAPGAKHAKSFETAPKEYQKKVGNFLARYM